MDIQYIRTLPIPACAVDPDGIISGANPLMKNVFVYDDIVGTKFFTMTGYKRDQLMNANKEEMVLERNGKLFKLWVNEEAKEDEDIVVFLMKQPQGNRSRINSRAKERLSCTSISTTTMN